MRNDQSTFTAEYGYLIDQFDELQDLRWSDLQYLEEYRELRMKKNDGLPIDQVRLDQLELIFKNKIITSARWNKFQNALVGMQTFIKNEVEGFVLEKQQEITDYTNTKKTEVETTVTNGQNAINSTKDSALISIENKKDNVIQYLDDTTAGALRNDIGDMAESVVQGRSLIDKTNLLSNNMGDLTIDDTLVPSTDTGLSIKILLSWLANMVKSITGKSSWRIKPVKSIEDLNTELGEHKADSMSYSTYKLNPDDNGIFTEIQYKRSNGTLIMKSILSGGTSPNYTTRTETEYEQDGITVKTTKVYTITYIDDKVTSEVLQ